MQCFGFTKKLWKPQEGNDCISIEDENVTHFVSRSYTIKPILFLHYRLQAQRDETQWTLIFSFFARPVD